MAWMKKWIFYLLKERRDYKKMIEIRIKDNENFDAALRRFKKEVQQSGVLSEMRRREHYEKPSVKKKLKILAARKKAKKRSF